MPSRESPSPENAMATPTPHQSELIDPVVEAEALRVRPGRGRPAGRAAARVTEALPQRTQEPAGRLVEPARAQPRIVRSQR